jgi:hypothetical protein
MKNLFVPYEIAKSLKEKGFVEPCFSYYMCYNLIKFPDKYKEPDLIDFVIDDVINKIDFYNHNQHEMTVSAPLYQQVTDWFREKHEIEIYCLKQIEEDEYGGIVRWSGVEDISSKSCFPDYCQALEAAILEALKLI